MARMGEGAAHAAAGDLQDAGDAARALHADGCAIVPGVLDESGCDEAIAHLQASDAMDDDRAAGCRDLLTWAWCRALAARLQAHRALAPMLPRDAVAVQCTLFEKSPARNWLVPLHQDLSIPVAERMEHPALAGWSRKSGTWFVQPPDAVLAKLLAVRLHLDDCGAGDGPLRVVPGSHRHGRVDHPAAVAMRGTLGEQTCPVPRGGALLMRPLLLHASSRAGAASSSRRRVLHFLLGQPALPLGLRWAMTVNRRHAP